MSITDILQETSKKHMNKNMVGDTIVQGVMVGIVAENNNKNFPGMVRVQIPTRDKNKNILQWMKVINLLGGKTWGGYIVPEIGEQVVVAFENGNINNAYVIGSIYKNDSEIPSKNYTDENYKKLFSTKGGNQIVFDDETDKQKITINTNSKQTITLDDEKKLISIKDKDSKNMIEINTEKGTMSVKVDNKLTIDINGITIEMLGDSKKISVKCSSVNIDADQSINLNTQNLKFNATTLDMSASASAKLASDGTVQIKGSIIKLG